MKTRSIHRYRALALASVACLALIAMFCLPTTLSSRMRLEKLKAGFTQRGGQGWFYGEQFADDVHSRLSALRNKFFPPAVNRPPPMPTATDAVTLPDNRKSEFPDS